MNNGIYQSNPKPNGIEKHNEKLEMENNLNEKDANENGIYRLNEIQKTACNNQYNQ